jgi:hypothetical protein
MAPPTPAWWKTFYAEERSKLDLDAIVRSAPIIDFPRALIFPHTRLIHSGSIVAAVARAAARTRKDVFAIGVVHGSPDLPRGIHEAIDGEFSLDNFRVLYERACAIEGILPMRVHTRFPVDAADPKDLPGLDDVVRLAESCAVVATTDPIHHGIGYSTSEAREENDATHAWARKQIAEQLAALGRRDWKAFAELCARDRSDFKNSGPVLALLAPLGDASIDDLTLVDYSDVFGCARPTWVAAARISVRPPS